MLTMKNSVFWDVTPRGSCKNRRFRGTYCFMHMLQLLVTANVVPNRPILFITPERQFSQQPHGVTPQ
jgi:hypothetical protein